MSTNGFSLKRFPMALLLALAGCASTNTIKVPNTQRAFFQVESRDVPALRFSGISTEINFSVVDSERIPIPNLALTVERKNYTATGDLVVDDTGGQITPANQVLTDQNGRLTVDLMWNDYELPVAELRLSSHGVVLKQFLLSCKPKSSCELENPDGSPVSSNVIEVASGTSKKIAHAIQEDVRKEAKAHDDQKAHSDCVNLIGLFVRQKLSPNEYLLVQGSRGQHGVLTASGTEFVGEGHISKNFIAKKAGRKKILMEDGFEEDVQTFAESEDCNHWWSQGGAVQIYGR